MCPFFSNLRSAQFALAVMLAWVWHVAGAPAQTAPVPKSAPLLSWSVGEQQPSAPARQPARYDRSVAPAVFNERGAKPLVKQPNSLTQTNQPAPVVRVATATSSVPVASSVTAAPQETVASDPRRLAPPSRPSTDSSSNTPASHDALPFSLPRIESFTTAGTGLAIVLGLFLMCVWLMRRSGPRPSAPLPKEAVAVLGRIPLAASHFAHLVQLGSKLVLVSVGPDSVTSLAEVTDPNEVNRLLGLCTRNHKNSTTAEFHQVLEELASEPARGFLGDQATRGQARPSRS